MLPAPSCKRSRIGTSHYYPPAPARPEPVFAATMAYSKLAALALLLAGSQLLLTANALK